MQSDMYITLTTESKIIMKKKHVYKEKCMKQKVNCKNHIKITWLDSVRKLSYKLLPDSIRQIITNLQ